MYICREIQRGFEVVLRLVEERTDYYKMKTTYD